MKTKILFIFILILSLFLSACKKDKDDKSLAAMAMLYLFGQKTDSASTPDNTYLNVTLKLIDKNTGNPIADTSVTLDTGASASIKTNVQPIKAETSSGSFETFTVDLPTKSTTTDSEGKLTLALQKNVPYTYKVNSVALGSPTFTATFTGTAEDYGSTETTVSASIQNAKTENLESKISPKMVTSGSLSYEVLDIKAQDNSALSGNTIPGPLSVRFLDTSQTKGKIGGTIRWTPPANENIDGYKIYLSYNGSIRRDTTEVSSIKIVENHDLVQTVSKGTYEFVLPERDLENYLSVKVHSYIGNTDSSEYAYTAIADKPDTYLVDMGFGTNGSVGSFGTGNGQMNYPGGIAIASNGDVYIADVNNNRIQVFTSTGAYLRQFGSYGTGNGEFKSPNRIAIASNGDVYVADVSNIRIQVFTSAGAYKSQFGSYGTGNSEFKSPTGLAIGGFDSVYVGDLINDRVSVFGAGGGFLTKFTTAVYNIATSPSTGDVFTNKMGSDNTISVWDMNGVFKKSFSISLTKLGDQLKNAFLVYQIRVSPSSDDVFATDPNGNRINIYSNAGVYKDRISSDQYGRVFLENKSNLRNDVVSFRDTNRPLSMVFDSNGNLYYTTSNNRITKLNKVTSYYTIGGNITGTGDTNGLVLLNNLTFDKVTLSTGATSFTFPTQDINFEVVIGKQPTADSICSITSGGGKRSASANVTDVVVNCQPAYSLGGTASGVDFAGLTLKNNTNGEQYTIPSGAVNFTFPTKVVGYNVSVVSSSVPTYKTCTLSNGTGTASAAVSNVAVSCVGNPYTIGGTVNATSAVNISGLVLNNGANNEDLTVNGTFSCTTIMGNTTCFGISFSFPTPSSAYNVTVKTQPSVGNLACSVSNGSGTAQANVTSVSVNCNEIYSVGGSISGHNNNVVIQNNSGSNQTIASGTSSFTFTSIAKGSNYNVSVLTPPLGQSCVVSNNSGTNISANVTNVSIVCSNISYTVSGTVSGHTGSLTLQNNGGSNQVINTGTSTYSYTGMGSNYNYFISVMSNPAGQTCTVVNHTAMGMNANVTDANITCTASSDSTAPTVISPTLSKSSVATTSFGLSWSVATDNVSASNALQYKVVRSSSPISTINDANSATVVQGYQLYSAYTQPFSITGLTASTMYHVNVVVKDEAGNESLYTGNSETTSSASLASIYIYEESNRMGNLGDRPTTSSYCASSSNKKTGCTNFKSFLSYTGDTIADMATFHSVPTNKPVKSTNLGEPTLAANWNDFVAGPITDTLGNTGVTSSDFWTGNTAFAVTNTCSNWTSSDFMQQGDYGYSSVTTAGWLFGANGGCGTSRKMLCICW